MYEELFQSSCRPFRATPDVRFYFPHESIETARQTVIRAVKRAEGPVMVLGGAGMGKSLLGELVRQDLGNQFDIIGLQATRLCSRKALLQNILFELRLPYRDLSEGELRLSILDRLEPSDDTASDGLLIVVDEAHTLPAKLLEELRLITNFTRDCQPRARLVLIGSMRLEDTFASPQMESFNQRLAARCYLSPMTREQTNEYVSHQIATAGYKPNEFMTSDGLNAVYAASEGVPRLANQIMDHALALAITNSQCPISSALVEEAWADLQQLPAPWQPLDNDSSQSTAIEFGSLDDEYESGPAPSAIVAGDPAAEACAEEPCKASGEIETSSAELDHPPELNWDEASEQIAVQGLDTQADSSEAQVPEFEVVDIAQQLIADSENTASEGSEGIAFDEASFFSAFTEPQQDELTEALHEAVPELDLSDDEAALVRPQFVFDASKVIVNSSDDAVETDAEPKHSDEVQSLPTDSFFCDRPTDEKMLAIAEEQAQYDAMGMWENDPPISENLVVANADHDTGHQDDSGSVDSPGITEFLGGSEIQNAQPSLAPEHEDSNSPSLFGDDFDEEVSIVLGPAGADASHPGERFPPVGTNMESAVEMDLVGAIESSTGDGSKPMDAGPVPQADEVVANSEIIGGVEPWSMDIAAVDTEKEVAVQNEIEDIVSQLNFSAFDVEPFSMEQIPLEAVNPIVGAVSETAPIDSIRSGSADGVYMMHRAEELAEQNIFTDASAHYDDDRDLLIIEEDLPVSTSPTNTHSNQVADPGTPKRVAPYSQLFAKLRK